MTSGDPGERRRLTAVLVSAVVLLAAAPGHAQDEPAAEPEVAIRVIVRAAAGQPAELPAGAHLEASHEESAGAPLRLRMAGPLLSVRLPREGMWRLCLEAEGRWAGCRTIEAEAGESVAPVTFTMWPAAVLTGQLRLDGEKALPEVVEVRVGPPPGPGPATALEESTLSCPIAQEGRFHCSVPATSFYAAVRRSGFVSRYFWDLGPSAGERVDLGNVTLAPGASLTGLVDLAPEGLEAKRLGLRLVPAVGAGTPSSIAGRVEETAQAAQVTARGFFQFSDIEPGAYMLEASHPSFATSSVGPIEIFTGKETTLRAVVQLLPPITLELLIDPPTAQGGRPWKVDVSRARDWSAGSDRVFRGEAASSGSLRLPGQSPGLFSISISDPFGNRFHDSEVRLTPGDSGFVPIAVSVLRVVGTLRLGGEPVEGWLMFGGRRGAERSRMRTDDEGGFAGLLPREGKWEVEVKIAEPPIDTVTQVEVVAGSDGTAQLDVELDDTELHGRVVDGDGLPVPGAAVKVDTFGVFVGLSRQTDEQGEFYFRALPGGPAAVAARGEIDGSFAMSDPVRVTLEDGVPTGPVELVLKRFEQVAGRVLSTTGPAAGARVFAATLGRPVPAVDSAVTDADGAFALRLPGDVALLGLVVLPPGRFLTTATVAVDGALELHTAERGGSLVVQSEKGKPGLDFHLVVERDGVSIEPGLLSQWSRGHGVQPDETPTVRFPRMGEGSYRVCFHSEEARQETLRAGGSWQDAAANATRCAQGFLPSGGELVLAPESD